VPRALATLAAIALLAACGGDGGQAAAAPSATVDTSALVSVPGRLLVLGTDGSVFTIAPDGSDHVVLAPAGPGRAATQPMWSPDGTRVAWVDIELRGGIPTGRVAASRADGSDRTIVEVGGTPFFLAWDPASSRVAYLHGDVRAGIALGVVDAAHGGRPDVIARGQPLYFDWAPDGRQLLVHIGDGYLGYVSLDGQSRPLVEAGATFRAPEWRRDDGRRFYAARLAGGDALVERSADDVRRELARLDGLIAFASSPDGHRIAYQASTPDDGPAGGSARSNIAQTQAAPAAPPDGLVVADLRTGATTTVVDEPVTAFFWSPAGDRLLYLVVEQTIRGLLTRWWTWDDAGTVRLDLFAPSLEYVRDYLPFFDQFARVSTPWSPDGTQFAYAGIAESGESGVWVQSADGAIPPILVADGVYAAWSP